MKLLLVLSVAIVASEAFFLPHDFFADIAQRFSNFHRAGTSSLRKEPLNDATYQKMKDLFETLSIEEQAALKNYIFGQRFPRPLPSFHHRDQTKISNGEQQSLTEEHIKSEAKEEKPEINKESFKNPQEHSRVRRSVQIINPLPDFESLVRPAHMSKQKLHMLREKLHSMTPEEREILKNKMRNHQEQKEAVNPSLIKPISEYFDTKLKRSPRSIQAIRPLPDFVNSNPLNPGDYRRPNFSLRPRVVNHEEHEVMPTTNVINFDANFSFIYEMMKEMSQEEKIKFLREIYPHGLPIRPLKQIIDPNYSHDHDDFEMNIQPY